MPETRKTKEILRRAADWRGAEAFAATFSFVFGGVQGTFPGQQDTSAGAAGHEKGPDRSRGLSSRD